MSVPLGVLPQLLLVARGSAGWGGGVHLQWVWLYAGCCRMLSPMRNRVLLYAFCHPPW
jgi:hypothetical protein